MTTEQMDEMDGPRAGDVVPVRPQHRTDRDYDTLIAKARAVNGAVFVDVAEHGKQNPTAALKSALHARSVSDVVPMQRKTRRGVELFFVRRDLRDEAQP